MGRMNNRRTQAAAEALKHTPSRARFSKGPPSKKSTGGRGRGRGGDATTNSTAAGAGRGGRGGASGRGSVIDKISKRVEQNKSGSGGAFGLSPSQSYGVSTSTTTLRKKRHPLDGIDIARLDEVKLSEESVQLVTKLLQDLNVVESEKPILVDTDSETDDLDEDFENYMGDYERDNDDDDDENDNEDCDYDEPTMASLTTGSGNYVEYEDDYEETDESYINDGTANDEDITTYQDNATTLRRTAKASEPKVDNNNNNNSALRESPLFQHLTTKLSFAEEQALRACRGIEGWNLTTNPTSDPTTGGQAAASSVDSERLALAMDWLCLHLSDQELMAGFKPKQIKNMHRTHPAGATSGILLAGTGRTRPIPHPSISIAKPLTSDMEWRESVRREARKIAFIRLGFSNAEAEAACNETKESPQGTKTCHQDEDAIRVMLTKLELDSVDGKQPQEGNLTKTDLEFCAEEREQEIEALAAIYEDRFQRSGDHLILDVKPVENLRAPAHTKECRLHVYIQPGYPILCASLMLFTNPTLPPSLLRRINLQIAQKANETLGYPSIFATIDFLANALPEMQWDFIKEQRQKEMEVEQIRMRKEAGHQVEADMDLLDETDANLGRRQRQKLKAANKAYDNSENLKQKEAKRLQKEEDRLKRIVVENKTIRMTMAERAVADRERQYIMDEAEKAARAAMSAALNTGATVEDARKVAATARKENLRFHGEEVSSDDDENEVAPNDPIVAKVVQNLEETTVPSKGTPKTSAFMDRLRDQTSTKNKAIGSTPQTSAFMERLRDFYNKAAQEKLQQSGVTSAQLNDTNQPVDDSRVQLFLSKPKATVKDDENELQTTIHIPAPVPIATGDLRTVMSDVIKVQKEQPWLVSPEARVPIEDSAITELTPSKIKERNDTSKRLKDEFDRKHRAADDWERINLTKGSLHGKGGPRPEQFHRMRSQRSRLPAYKMQEKIVGTIERHQITVISGDTGKCLRWLDAVECLRSAYTIFLLKGCGKTTQVPQLVLDDMISKGRGAEASMIVTQPRRISAIGVSERIAAERCEKVGETAGYSIRLENKRSQKTRILLCTTGILLRRLQCDPDLASVSHIFVDEVHERDLNTDFLLIILKDLLARRKGIKLVLMSATLNADAFANYFTGCPIVSIPGRAFPVEENRLEDILQLTGYVVDPNSDYAHKSSANRPTMVSKSSLKRLYHPKYKSHVIDSLAIANESVINYELVAKLLEHITLKCDDGAILVFMSGMQEITKTVEELYKKEIFQSSKVLIYPLHSSLSTAEQTAVFEVPPKGVRKIVIATNIAETSITIEDVVYVVDTSKVKENRKDEVNEMPTLVETWVSRASAKQRRGRAGRVKAGISYHFYSSHTFDHEMQEYQLPEMLRVGLEDLVLQILLLDLGDPTAFLAKAVNPPSALAMKNSLKLLEGLGAVEVDWKGDDLVSRKSGGASEEVGGPSCETVAHGSGLTALGFHLATLPVDPRVGKMMIYGALFGCIDPALTIAASMSARSPFMSPFDKRDQADEARQQFATDGSDHLTTLTAFTTWKEMRQTKGDKVTQNFLHENFLSRLTLFQIEDLREQFAALLVDIGFLPKGFRLQGSLGRGGRGRGGGRGGRGNQAQQPQGPPSPADANSTNMALVKAILCAGLYPNIIVAPRNLVRGTLSVENKTVGECAFASTKGDVYLHPCTISFKEKTLDSRYCCYHDIVKTSKIYVRDCTSVSEFALLLFGGSLKVYHTHGVVACDEWLKFRISAKPATLVKHLRAQMESMLLKKIVSPEEDVTGSKEGQALIQAVSTLLEREKRTIPDGADIVRPYTGNGYSQQGRNGNGGGRSYGSGRDGGRGRGRSGRDGDGGRMRNVGGGRGRK